MNIYVLNSHFVPIFSSYFVRYRLEFIKTVIVITVFYFMQLIIWTRWKNEYLHFTLFFHYLCHMLLTCVWVCLCFSVWVCVCEWVCVCMQQDWVCFQVKKSKTAISLFISFFLLENKFFSLSIEILWPLIWQNFVNNFCWEYFFPSYFSSYI